jgi:hypothetical protein
MPNYDAAGSGVLLPWHSPGETRDVDVTSVKVLVPNGVVGSGFSESALKRGVEAHPDAIAADGGSTDSGPFYLGAGVSKMTKEATARDLRLMMLARDELGVPLIIGSCGTSGTDSGVDWMRDIAVEISHAEGLRAKVASIYSEPDREHLKRRLAEGRVVPLRPELPIDASLLDACSHIVAVMGVEPINDALQSGADIVLAGRATDTALIAAVPLATGFPAGPSWHAAKTVECGGLCTVGRPDPVLVTIDDEGFTVEALGAEARCTPNSVASHMLYENADPFRLREPAGELDTQQAVYRALDERRVRVEGSRFRELPYTIKLEGSQMMGFRSAILAGLRDPYVLDEVVAWTERLKAALTVRIERTFGLSGDEFRIDMHRYGHDALLGEREPDRSERPREVGLLITFMAHDQETARRIAKLSNPTILHHAIPHWDTMATVAFPFSPAEFDLGPAYRFVLNHVVQVDNPLELTRTVLTEV